MLFKKTFINCFFIISFMLSPLSLTIFLPSLPDMVTLFHTNKEMIQSSLTFMLLGAGVSHPFWGSLSDHFGRKPILTLGLTIFIVGASIAAGADQLWQLFIGCACIGSGMAANSGLIRAVVRDMYKLTKTTRLLAIGAIITGVTPAAAVCVGDIIHIHFGWRMNFIILALTGGIGMLLIRFYFDETLYHSKSHKVWRITSILKGLKKLLRDGKFVAYFLGVGLVYASPIIIAAEAPFIFTHHYVTYYALIVASYVCGSLCVYHFLNKKTMKHFIRAALFFMISSAGFLLISFYGLHIKSLYEVMLCLLLYQLGSGMLLPILMAKAMNIYPKHAGLASAILGIGRAMTPAAALCVLLLLHLSIAGSLALVMFVLAILTFILMYCFTSSLQPSTS